jgi:uncharacterized GH25 family protein
MRIFALVLSLLASPAVAHEFWIEPLAYQVEADGRLEAHLVNGQDFAGVKIPYLPRGFANFITFTEINTAARVRGRLGDMPALQQNPLGEGLNVVVYQANPSTIKYAEWAKFQAFIEHKDFGDILSIHQARGLPEEGFTEIYARFSKSLIGVGNGVGSDTRVGLTTEIVALTNPYTDDLADGVKVQLFYLNEPRAEVQIEVFEKGPDDTVEVSFYRTDAEGIATFPVNAGHSYMLDAVVLREPSDNVAAETGAVWETLWANMTFAVPQ